MLVKKYELKFTHLSKYSPHMVADSRAQMSKFLFSVYNLIKSKCRNDIFLGDMDTSKLMSHAPQDKGDKLRKMSKEIKSSWTRNYEYTEQRSGGGNISQFQNKSTTQTI